MQTQLKNEEIFILKSKQTKNLQKSGDDIKLVQQK